MKHNLLKKNLVKQNLVKQSNGKIQSMLIYPRIQLLMLLMCGTLFFSACQHVVPPAQGLITPAWQAKNYQRQDQIEVQWKNQGLSFLLYQQQRGQTLEMLALTLTGQPLFQLTFDGNTVKVQQRIEPMKRLPFDYVVRDILYATYPDFIQLQNKQVMLKQVDDITQVYIKGNAILNIQPQKGVIELNNIQVPYQMNISPVSDTLQNNEAQHVE